ncbi:hypothetical protein PEDI_42200 [Persicobacter diffluens]|uniref:Uncharacterized protein n=1 Tax=Persicobacter diffluens TaxID=981 RepID=A0AAN4W1L6_9BACT|nr:hypothetical protein PEDI_42200 [Persicobacter diffluens]
MYGEISEIDINVLSEKLKYSRRKFERIPIPRSYLYWGQLIFLNKNGKVLYLNYAGVLNRDFYYKIGNKNYTKGVGKSPDFRRKFDFRDIIEY